MATQLRATPPVMHEVAHGVLFQKRAHQMQNDLLRDGLKRESHVAVPVGDRLAGAARGAECGDELALERTQLSEGIVAEIVHVDGIAAIRRGAYDIAEPLDEGVLAEGRERHHLAFVAEAGKAQILGDEGVDEPGRVHDAGGPDAVQPVAPAHIGAAGAIVAVAVHDENERLLERRDKEHRGVGVVMGHVDDGRQLHLAEGPAHDRARCSG